MIGAATFKTCANDRSKSHHRHHSQSTQKATDTNNNCKIDTDKEKGACTDNSAINIC